MLCDNETFDYSGYEWKDKTWQFIGLKVGLFQHLIHFNTAAPSYHPHLFHLLKF